MEPGNLNYEIQNNFDRLTKFYSENFSKTTLQRGKDPKDPFANSFVKTLSYSPSTDVLCAKFDKVL